MLLTIISLLISQAIGFVDYIEKHGRIISPSYKESNCVQFLTKIYEDYHGIKFTKAETREIYIMDYTMEQVNDIIMNSKKDTTKLDGMVDILVNKGMATRIKSLNDATVGCIIQYWCYYTKDGKTKIVYGHSAVIRSIDSSNGDIYIASSHPKNNGYGITKLEKEHIGLFGIKRIAICKPK